MLPTVNYHERMLGYYPQVIQSILEFQAIVDSEYPEIELGESGVTRVTEDAYLTTMTEERIAQWEKMLGIQPLENSTLNDRRDTIIARIRGQGKLNTELINRIVSSFTGGTADAWVKDGVLCIEVHIPDNSKPYKAENLERELAAKVPAHLRLEVMFERRTWGDVTEQHSTWNDVHIYHESWLEVMRGVHRKVGTFDNTPIEEFVLV